MKARTSVVFVFVYEGCTAGEAVTKGEVWLVYEHVYVHVVYSNRVETVEIVEIEVVLLRSEGKRDVPDSPWWDIANVSNPDSSRGLLSNINVLKYSHLI